LFRRQVNLAEQFLHGAGIISPDFTVSVIVEENTKKNPNSEVADALQRVRTGYHCVSSTYTAPGLTAKDRNALLLWYRRFNSMENKSAASLLGA
jgi:hypothetical protein